ncbi:MAG: arylesterase [Rhodospirillales bacterium]|nr:arylesterase [Rhodospirillales bacterium]MBO6787779.1 arylesterase [Rhodospirillales bacterium]
MWLRRIIATVLLCTGVVTHATIDTQAAENGITLVVLGDSLSAGYGLPAADAFPAKLEKALGERGYAVRVENSGVSGDTTAGGRARLGWAIGNDPGGVILELGANDALRGLEPERAYDNLAAMLSELKAKNIPVLLAGMKAPPNMGEDYAKEFDAVYTRLAREFDVVFYPFFLDGVAGTPSLNQDDGIHPTAEGVDVIVERIMPEVEALLDRAGLAKGQN